MSSVDLYIAELNGAQKDLAILLNSLIMSNDTITNKIRYRVPFYYQKSWICYLNPIKKGGIELCFLRANEMSNDLGLLDFKDRKQVAGISYFDVEEVDIEAVQMLFQEAMVLDEYVKYPSKNTRRK